MYGGLLGMAIKMRNSGHLKLMMQRWYNNINILNDHQINKDNNKALLAIAMFESVYTSKKIFDEPIFEFLQLLDKRKIDHIISEIAESDIYRENPKDVLGVDVTNETIQIIALMIQAELPINKGLARQCTDVKYSDDVVVVELGIYKVTLLKYETKFRLLYVYNKDKKRTTSFNNYFFDSAEDIFTYMNNIDEYSEFTADVLEMIKY